MKRSLLTLILFMAAFASFAQKSEDSSKHLNFKGVPIDGTLDQYVSKMKRAGFSHSGTDNGVALLNGDFASYKDCNIEVSTLKQKDLVYKIGVRFPEKDNWAALSGDYFNLKQLLTEKYGEPSEIVERFDRSSQEKSDMSKMLDVKTDGCKYYSVWKTDKGTIRLSIDHNTNRDCFVTLSYFDKANGETIKKQALDDL